MPRTAKLKKRVCSSCGVDVRKGTMFCYNCGTSVSARAVKKTPESNGAVPAMDAETQAALDDLAARLKIDEEADSKLAKAAAERKTARVNQRRTNEYRWEPVDDSSARLSVLIAVLILVVTAGVVFVTVFWK